MNVSQPQSRQLKEIPVDGQAGKSNPESDLELQIPEPEVAITAPEQRARVNKVLPGGEGDRSRIFKRNVEQLAAWAEANGRWPKNGATDQTEKRLAGFLNGIRTAARGKGPHTRTFTLERRAYLDEVLPGWAGDRSRIFKGNVDQLAAWVEANGRWPKQGAADQTERRLAKFLNGTRTAARGKGNQSHTFTPERRAYLDKVFPGWEGDCSLRVFKGNVDELAAWKKANGRWPKHGAADQTEKLLVEFLYGTRTAARGKGPHTRTFTPERRAYLDEVLPGWEGDRSRIFKSNVDELAVWAEANGRWPKHGAADQTERRLAGFLYGTRTAARGKGDKIRTFTLERRAYLDEVLPGWEGDRSRIFKSNVDELAVWAEANGRWPKNGAADQTERRLAGFLYGTRTAARRKGNRSHTLTPERRAYLDEVLPGWAGDRSRIFKGNVDQLAAWVEANGRWPKQGAADQTERRLVNFLSNTRTAAREKGNQSHTFTPERRAYIDKVFPGWEGDCSLRVFKGNVDELAAWVEANGCWPQHGAAHQTEKRLVNFLNRTRTAARGKGGENQTFTPERHAYLDEVLPGWEGDRYLPIFKSNVEQLAAWVEANGRWPRGRAVDQTEKRLAKFLSNTRTTARGKGGENQTFTPERRAYLDEVLPGWAGDRSLRVFRRNVDELAAWKKTNGRWPRGKVVDQTEKRLAKFLDNTRTAARGKGNQSYTFTPERRAYIDEMLPGWEC
ncbi:MAG: hypothetical protein ACYDEP_02365 [Acidimicrobiales bacterium]